MSHYIREFGIRNAKINRVNEQKKFVYPIYFCVSYPDLALVAKQSITEQRRVK